jgi:hypothetical protein
MAAWTQSADEEKAQIGAIIPALSRTHQLSARAAAAGRVKSAANAPIWNIRLMFAIAHDMVSPHQALKIAGFAKTASTKTSLDKGRPHHETKSFQSSRSSRDE